MASSPKRIKNLEGDLPCEDIVDIASNSSHSLALDSKGRVYSWGNG